MQVRRRRVAFICVGALLFVSAPAAAADTAAAQTLFDEAKKLVAEDNYAAACVKFEESQKLDPGMGTLFNLADCFEHVGKTASAWGAFLDVAAQASAQNQKERADVASSRAQALAPKLARLTINVTVGGTSPSAIRVQRDSVDVGPGQWGSNVPIDPGEHTITALAPGKKSWRTTVVVAPGVSPPPVVIPELAADAGPNPVAPPSNDTAVPENDDGRTRRWIGLGVAGAGVVGLAVGAVFGLSAKSKLDDSAPHCDAATNHCDATGVSLRDDSLKAGTISTLAFLVGGAAVVGGAVLYLTAPKKLGAAASSGVMVAPVVGNTAGGVSLRGDW
jgi:hypothetical protein